MPSQTFDTIGMRLSQLAEQHELSNNPAYFAWLQRAMADGMGREAARRHAAEAILRFGNNGPIDKTGPQRPRPEDEDLPPPRKSPPTPAGENEDAPRDGVSPRLSVSAQPSLTVSGVNPLPNDYGLDPDRLSRAAASPRGRAPAASAEEAAALRFQSNDPPPYAYGQGPASASAQVLPSVDLPTPTLPYAYGQGPASASAQVLPPPQIPNWPFENGSDPKQVLPSVAVNSGQELVRAVAPAIAAGVGWLRDGISAASQPLLARPGASGPLPYAYGQGPSSAQAQAEVQNAPTQARPQQGAPASPPAPVDKIIDSMVSNGMSREDAIAAVKAKYPGVEVPSGPAAPPSGGKQSPPKAKGPSAGERDAAVRAMIEQTRRPGMSREDRANAIARAMLQNEINHLVSQGYDEADAAKMVNMESISRAANRQLVSEEVQEGIDRGRQEDAEARRKAVTATGPEAKQMATEDAVTQRIRNQNQNARTRGLGGQNRLWDENDPETRAMVAQQIAAEAKAATEKEIAATGLGSRRVPTPRGAGGERSKQGAAFESAQDAENYNRRLPAQPALGDDGLPAGGKPGLYTPSQKDRDMAARGYVPTYGPNGEIGYSIAAFAGGENAPPGAPGRAGDRRDLRVKGWMEEERLGPTGMQRVLVPGSEVQERMLQKQDKDLIERLRTRAGVSEEQLRTLRKGADGEPGLNNTALIERLRMMGNDRKAEDLAARKANARSHAMLAGPNAARNAVNAFNMLPPDWQATVTAKALRPDLAGTTPNDAAVAAAQAAGRGGGVLERLEAMRMQMEQDRMQHEERMFTLRNQGEPERQKVASAMEDKKINEQAVAAGAPVHVVRSLQAGDYFTPEVEKWLVRIAGQADTYDLPAWFGGSGYAEGDAERFKASLSAAGVSDPAVQDQLWEHATKLRDAQAYLPWNPGG